MPFDAMKGLSEALRDREERHLRIEKHDVSEEQAAANSEVLGMLRKEMTVRVECHIAFHDVLLTGKVEKIDRQTRQISIDGRIVPFSDIYEIVITDV